MVLTSIYVPLAQAAPGPRDALEVVPGGPLAGAVLLCLLGLLAGGMLTRSPFGASLGLGAGAVISLGLGLLPFYFALVLLLAAVGAVMVAAKVGE